MVYRLRRDNKIAFRNNCFKKFTDAVGMNLDEFTDLVYSKYDVECFQYSDDVNYWAVGGYFNERLIPHKINVFQAGIEISRMDWFTRMNIARDQFIDNLYIHDLSKFSAVEALPYALHDFSNGGKGSVEFQIAWCHHKCKNEHHPEFWLNPNRKGEVNPLPMPDIFIAEMIADWIGAGKTYGDELITWAPKNIDTFNFHPETEQKVRTILKEMNIEL